jgi:hypothetical protein
MSSYAWHSRIRTTKGYRSKSFPPDRLSPFPKSRFFRIATQSLGERGRVRGPETNWKGGFWYEREEMFSDDSYIGHHLNFFCRHLGLWI